MILRRATYADLGRLLERFARTYGRTHILAQERFFTWFFANGGDENGYGLFVALNEEDQIIGWCSSHLIDGSAKEQNIIGRYIALLYVEPAWRQTVCALRLILMAGASPYSVVAGPNDDASALFSGLKWHGRFAMKRAIAPLNPQGIEVVFGVQTSAASPRRTSQNYQLELSERPRGQEGELWARFASHVHAFAQKRHADHLRWRYQDHPYFHHQFLYAVRGHELRAMAVLRFEGEDQKYLRILELFGDTDAMVEVLRAALDFGRSENALFADFFFTTGPYSDFLSDGGFTPRYNEQIPYRLSPIDHGVGSIFYFYKNPRHITLPLYMTKGDFGQDRPNIVESR